MLLCLVLQLMILFLGCRIYDLLLLSGEAFALRVPRSEARRPEKIGEKTMFKYFVFDFNSNRYFALSGVHGADFAKQFAPCDYWIKIPFFLYYSPAFSGFKLDKLR